MAAREPEARALYDYASDYQWLRMLGWTQDELQRDFFAGNNHSSLRY